MSRYFIKGGSTSKIIELSVRDSTTGAGKTGVAHSSITASYVREGGTRVAITLASGVVADVYSSGKWCEVDATNMKGIYQLHLPNAAIATGVAAVTITLQATGMIDKAIPIDLEMDLSNTTIGSISGGGTGARTATLTVHTSGAVAIQGAIVRVTKGTESFTQTTNSSGQVVFNLNDGTWTVAITASGYSFTGTTLVVDGVEAVTYTMTTNSVTAPAAPNLSTGTLLCLGTNGLLEVGVVITFRMTVGPGSAGYSLDSTEFTATSDATGRIEVPHVQLAQYVARRGTIGREVAYTVPAATSFTLPEQLGTP